MLARSVIVRMLNLPNVCWMKTALFLHRIVTDLPRTNSSCSTDCIDPMKR